MRTSTRFLFSVILVITWSCNQTKHQIIAEHSDKGHWSYKGETAPIHWAEIEKNSDCNGHHQSPINIIHKDVDSVKINNDLAIYYAPTTLLKEVENNGHSIQFDFESGDSINYQGKTFYLKQIHFHEPSEHRINGMIYPIEMHLVHVSKKGELTVLGVLGEEGEDSQLFEFFESFLPLENGAVKDIHQKIDLSSLFLEEKHYYSYGGSLTTPPCTENVNWVVFKEPIVLSVQEVLKLKSNMPVNNYRNEQALNGRIVNYHY